MQRWNCFRMPSPRRTATANFTAEPRTAGEETLTRWDLSISPKLRMSELKLAPSRKDVEEWISRIAASIDRNEETRYALVYAETSTPFLSTVSALRRLAVEAGSDADWFTALCAAEQVETVRMFSPCSAQMRS
jgi:hypothetical protein